MKPKQLNFSDFIYIVIQKPILLKLLEQFINIEELIPLDWHLNYNKRRGRHHNNSLTYMPGNRSSPRKRTWL